MAWTITSSTVINLPNGAKVYEGYFDALLANLDNMMGSTSTGMAASVTVLGNRTAQGEFIQRSSTSSRANAVNAVAITNHGDLGTITYPVAYASAPIVLVGGTASAAYNWGAAYSITQTNFVYASFDTTNRAANDCGWIAIGA